MIHDTQLLNASICQFKFYLKWWFFEEFASIGKWFACVLATSSKWNSYGHQISIILARWLQNATKIRNTCSVSIENFVHSRQHSWLCVCEKVTRLRVRTRVRFRFSRHSSFGLQNFVDFSLVHLAPTHRVAYAIHVQKLLCADVSIINYILIVLCQKGSQTRAPLSVVLMMLVPNRLV